MAVCIKEQITMQSNRNKKLKREKIKKEIAYQTKKLRTNKQISKNCRAGTNRTTPGLLAAASFNSALGHSSSEHQHLRSLNVVSAPAWTSHWLQPCSPWRRKGGAPLSFFLACQRALFLESLGLSHYAVDGNWPSVGCAAKDQWSSCSDMWYLNQEYQSCEATRRSFEANLFII